MRIKNFKLMLLAIAFLASSVAAEPLFSVEGTTAQGKPFKLASLRGKVVLLMFWSTDCAVCRDKMPELRMNYEGWHDKPFELVMVSLDRKKQDVDDYEKLIAHLVPPRQRFIQLWSGEPAYADNIGKPARLPTTFLIDKAGRVIERYTGRIPAEAWDRIADLL